MGAPMARPFCVCLFFLFAHKLAPDEAAQNAVDEGNNILILISLCKLHGLVDGGGGGDIGHIEDLADGAAHDGGGGFAYVGVRIKKFTENFSMFWVKPRKKEFTI